MAITKDQNSNLITWDRLKEQVGRRLTAGLMLVSLLVSMNPLLPALADTTGAASTSVAGTSGNSGTTANVSANKLPIPPRPPMPVFNAAKIKTGSRKVVLFKPKVEFSKNPTDAEIISARIFLEPLVPMNSKAVKGENLALANALTAFKAKMNPEQVSDLTAFLAKYPTSRWRASLELNLGLLRFETGYLTDAIKYWQSAWNLSKADKGQMQTATADRAISELVMIDARLGRMDELEKYLHEIGGPGTTSASSVPGAAGTIGTAGFKRGMRGSNEEQVQIAREGLFSMQHAPQTSFKCGPYAVNTLWQLQNKNMGQHDILKNAASTKKGTNLAQVKDWADEVGLSYQMAKRGKDGAFVVPCVMHWKLGHFAAITAQRNGKYRVIDPTFGSAGSAWITAQALETETDGYFLIPQGPLPTGWQTVSRSEAQKVWGKGNAETRNEGAKTKQSPKSNPAPGGDGCEGMARPSAFTMQATLNLDDIPLSYPTPIGPDMDFEANYNYLEANQPSSPTFPNFGPDWSFNWVSYLTVDASKNATVMVRGGGSETYKFTQPDNVTNPYPPNLLSQAVLAVVGSGIYQRQLADGSIEVFNQPDGSGRIFMTQVIDPQGNSATIQYDGNFRITAITDAIGRASSITYVSNSVGNSGYYKIATITDPFGRSASFTYDSSNVALTSISDTAGVTSQFSTNSSTSFIASLTTPYGVTSFYQYTPQSLTYPPRGLRFRFPDGSASTIENWIGETKQTYYWDRQATSLYPLDPANQVYTHCQTTKFLFDSAGSQESPVINWTKPPLESQITYTTEGEYAQNYLGTSNLPIRISRILSGNSTTNATIAGTVTSGNILTITVYDSGLSGGQQAINYTVQTGDTLNSIATGLTTAINANGNLQGISVSAVAKGAVVILSSASSNTTTYGQSTSSGATETITLNDNVNYPYTATIGGSATAGDILTIAVLDAGLPGGQQLINYTVQSGDTLTSIAQGLTAEISSKTSLQNIGVSATSSSAVVTLRSISTSLTQYAQGTSTGATETIALAQSSLSNIQVYNYTYNPFGRVTQSIDPIGRTFTYKYAVNNIDLLEQRETKGTDNYLMGKWQYNNSKHVPSLYIDGSGRQTSYTYNSFGQLATVTDANGNTTTLTYTNFNQTVTIGGGVTVGNVLTITTFDSGLPGGQQAVNYTVQGGDTLTAIATGLKNAINANSNLAAIGVTATSSGAVVSITCLSPNGTTYSTSLSGGATETMTLSNFSNAYLSKIDGPLSGSQDITTFSYDGYGNLYSVTNSTGYQILYNYDNANRVTKVIYPDATFEQFVYSNLDLSMYKDRIGRWTQNIYDSLDQLVQEIDPLGRKTKYVWCTCGSIATLTDPANHITTWNHDLEGRVTQKIYADGTDVDYVYEPTTSRLKSKTDALSQIINYTYNLDNTLSQKTYTAPVNPTSTVTYSYDQTFPRISAIQNGWGTYTYSYNAYITDPFGSPTTGGGRLASITNNVISNSNITFTYDNLGRVTNRSINSSANSDTWTYDAMSRITAETNTLGNFTYNYVDNTGGSSKGCTRLSSIDYPNSQTTKFEWYAPSGDERLKQINNLNPSAAVLSQFNYSYNPAGEITTWQQQQNKDCLYYGYTYDAAGQLVAAQAGSGQPYPPNARQNYYTYDVASNRTSVQNNTTYTARIGGTKTTSDVLTITVLDPALSGGSQAVNYTVQAGDNLTSIAAGLAAAITANSNLQTIGVDAVSNGTAVNIRSVSQNVTTYTSSLSGGSTETITLGVYKNGRYNATIGGTKTTSDTVTITVVDPSLGGGSEAVTYTVQAGDNLTGIATGLKNAINANTNLQTLGVTATSAGTVITLSSTSVNLTTYTKSTSGGATETITLAANWNAPQTALIGGTKTTSDTLTITFFDAGLGGGTEAITYTVQSGDNLTAIATGLTSAINGNSDLQSMGISATSSGTRITINSNSPNLTTYRQSTNNAATENIALVPTTNVTETAVIGGSKTTSDVLTITVYDPQLSGGNKAINYTVQGGDTLTTIAAGIATAINGDSDMQAIGVSATSASTVLNISSISVNTTTYASSLSGGATETITLGKGIGVMRAGFNNVNELVGITTGGNVRFQGTTNKTIKSAVVSSQTIAISANSPNATTYSQSTSGGATETITLGTNVAGSQTALIGGTKTTSDVLTITVNNSGLPGGTQAVNYTVQSGDTLTTIAAGLAAAINANTNLQAINVTATNSSTGVLGFTENFTGNPTLVAGNNNVTVAATDANNSTTSNSYQMIVNGGTGQTLTYDANGNMTDDGTNTYQWDAENRLVQINYPGSNNNSQFVYDGLGRCVKILEVTAGSTTSTKQFVWCGNQCCEVRDGSSTLVNQFFLLGQTTSGTTNKYCYFLDHPGSIREMNDNSGVIQAQYGYNAYGQASKLQGSLDSDFQYGGYYFHNRSGLNLALYRTYSSSMGRWLNRDPIGENGGMNLYCYVGNKPIQARDLSGLCPEEENLNQLENCLGDCIQSLKQDLNDPFNIAEGIAGAPILKSAVGEPAALGSTKYTSIASKVSRMAVNSTVGTTTLPMRISTPLGSTSSLGGLIGRFSTLAANLAWATGTGKGILNYMNCANKCNDGYKSRQGQDCDNCNGRQ